MIGKLGNREKLINYNYITQIENTHLPIIIIKYIHEIKNDNIFHIFIFTVLFWKIRL